MTVNAIAFQIMIEKAPVQEGCATLLETFYAVRDVPGSMGEGLRSDLAETIADTYGVSEEAGAEVVAILRDLSQHLLDALSAEA